MEDCCSWCCMSLSSKPVADGHPAFVPWPMLLCCYTQEVIGTTYKNIGCIRNLPLEDHPVQVVASMIKDNGQDRHTAAAASTMYVATS
eukprot:703535-Pelagomonas_calceolata.AAC.4